MRDMRDPQEIGERLFALRSKTGWAVSTLVNEVIPGLTIPDYTGGEFMSSDPAEHHSKTPQRLGDLSDGGE